MWFVPNAESRPGCLSCPRWGGRSTAATASTKCEPAGRSVAPRDFMDVTDRVADVVDRAGITEGWVGLFSKHTTAAVVINENEPLLLADMAAMLERLSATDATYGHNDFTIRTVNMHADECANGHAHCQHLLLSSSQSVPLADGHLDLGEWQRIFFVELGRPRDRQLVVQVFGI